MNTREQLGYYKLNQLQIVLKNGMKVTAPALDVLGALLFVLTEDQRTRLFNTLVASQGKPFMFDSRLTVPATLPKGYTDGIHTF